jgi:glyoxylase-like metal-dependent hydrolase (beta-lactamase superfamily II)
MAEPSIITLHEPVTGTQQQIVFDPDTRKAVIIDSVLDYDKTTGTIATRSADEILAKVGHEGLHVTHILETHAHADHLSASRYLQDQLAGKSADGAKPLICIGRRIKDVQKNLAATYSIPNSAFDGAFNRYFDDGETFMIGNIYANVIALPGHTPDHIGYLIGSNVFTGDSIFNPDVGSARCDFPGGSATDLYKSMTTLLALPEHFKIYSGHDYPPASRDIPGPQDFATVAEHRAHNKHVKVGTEEKDFVNWRSERDSGLSEPKLLKISMNVNLRGGRLPSTVVDGFPINDLPNSVARLAKI